jgi:hypothetical protein
MHSRQFEIILLDLALKLGLHPVAIAHLSPGTSSLLVSKMPTGGFTDIGRDYMNALYFSPIHHRCIMDKSNHYYLNLLQENPFFYCLDQIWVHLLDSQIPTGESTDVGTEYMNIMNSIHFCHMFYMCISDEKNCFYFILLPENPFFYCLDQVWVHLLVSQIPAGGTTDVGMECMDVIHLLSYVLYMY